MILSIDVGSRNLGLCVLQEGPDALGRDDAILQWRVFELPAPVSSGVLCDVLAEVLDAWDFEEVVIERQPGKNQLMQRIQHYCEMLFWCKGKRVTVIEASRKLSFAAKTEWWPAEISTEKWTYRTRKSAAVKTVRAFLQNTGSVFEEFYGSCAKKDDLADALLQAMAYAHDLKRT